jgi:hypothetical protein
MTAPTYEDMLLEANILSYLVNERPEGETIPELSRRFSPDVEGGEIGDGVERAVRELVGTGLLCIERGKVIPSPPSRLESRV